ncbi:uncharacterized protein V1516DRAFT_708437 [Lipomyces oligophaga]|uniref:uncharacterized protein n=1 Tax=Lipomyces oligophaga TaxID=45792 RepID=UPI0034CDCCDD
MSIFRPSGRLGTSRSRPTIKAEPQEPVLDEIQYDQNLSSLSYSEKHGKRYHIIKFASNKTVDPLEFSQPVTLQRKDPRSLRYEQKNPLLAELEQTKPDKVKTEVDEASGSSAGSGPTSVPDPAPTEEVPPADAGTVAPNPKLNVAPDGYGRGKKKQTIQRRITKQVYTNNEEARKLRYEEHYPWLLEDFDGQNTWVGSYEAAQSDCYVLFVVDEDGFKMIPAEKWYKFTPRNKYQTLSLEQAEEILANKSQPSRWLMRQMGSEQDQADIEPAQKRLKTVDGRTRVVRKHDDEGDELDFDEEFADDEEAPIMEGPEDENREVEQRMKRQMQSKEEEDAEKLAAAEEKNRRMGEEGKKMKESLRSLENNAIYESDDDEEDEDPFGIN